MSIIARKRSNPNAAPLLPLVALPLLALAGCTDIPSAPATASAGPPPACQLHLLADLPAGPAANSVLVPVAIDGKQTLMTLDLDGGNTYVFKQAMQRDGITALADMPSQMAVPVKSIRIGTIELDDLAVSIYDYHSYDYYPRALNIYPSGWGGGLSGWVLSRYDIEFDLGHGRVRLFEHNTCHGPIQDWQGPLVSIPFKYANTPQWTQGPGVFFYYVKFPVLINGRAALATIDPTDENYMLDFPIAAFGMPRDAPSVTPIIDARDLHPQQDKEFRATIRQVTIGNAVLSNVPVIIGGDGLQARPLLKLGMQFLHLNRVYIAWADHMVYLTPYAAMPP